MIFGDEYKFLSAEGGRVGREVEIVNLCNTALRGRLYAPQRSECLI